MGIGSLGVSELAVIFVIVLVFFGPRRFPEIARSMGHAMREFRRSLNQIQRELEDADPRSAIPGRDILNDIRSGKPGKWLDPNSPPSDRATASPPGDRSPAETPTPPATGEASGGPPVEAGRLETSAEPPAEPTTPPPPVADPASAAGRPIEQLPMFNADEESAPKPSTEDRPAD